jgi:hypothetical protein
LTHILLPYAGWLPGAADDLPLPALHGLLSKMQLLRQDFRPETAFFYLKHETALATAYGLKGAESGQLPLAALARWRAGLAPAAGEVWGRISLCQWQIGMNDGQLRSPAQLAVGEAEAADLWQALSPLLAERGVQIEPYPVLPPCARHVRITGLLADLPCASVERVAGLELSDYLPRAQTGSAAASAARWQSLLAEVQMLLYRHPVNDAREARRLPTLNSLWLDGVGALPADFAPAEVQVIADLQQAAERGDIAAWRMAWQRIEVEQVPQWQAAVAAGQPLHLELCGLQRSAVFTAQPQSWRQRLAQPWQSWRGKIPAAHWPSDLAQG